MKIGFFVWEYPPRLVGGLGIYAQNLCSRLVKLGHDITLFTMNNGTLKTREIKEGVEIHRPLLVGVSDIFSTLIAEDIRRQGERVKFFEEVTVYNILSAAKFCNELIKKEGESFDIISVHDWLSGVSGIIIKQNTNLPMVFHFHSTEWGRSGGQGSEIIRQIEEKAGKVANKIVTVSYEMQQDLIRHGFEQNKISVVWNGIDPEKYNPEKINPIEIQKLRQSYGISENEKMILFVGRLTWVKGVIELVQAMSMVVKRHPEAKLVILGLGELKESITHLISSLGLEQSVKTNFKFVSEEEKILHYAACDLTVFPSKYEPFGIVALEAMAMEKPIVVGTNGISGFKEQVIPSGPEQTGFHVNGSDPTDIANWGIIPALDDIEAAKEMGRRGRERVKKFFTWEKTVEQTLKVYQGVVERIN